MNVDLSMSRYIHLSKYSRWLEEEGRRETWDETVDRLGEFWASSQPDVCIRGTYGDGPKQVNTVWEDVVEAVKNLEVMPSMRSLMTAGPALRRDHAAGFNCFSGDTKFLTDKGYRRFSDFIDGDITKVLTKDGSFREATVRSFGSQRLQRVTLRPNKGPSNIRRSFKVTKDHRWITGRGETTSLQVGDSIPFIGRRPNKTELAKEYLLRGLLFGDGTLDKRGRARIRLCGTKSKYLHLFEEFGDCSIMHPPSFHGDPLVVFHAGVLTDCKELPTHCKDLDALSAWLLGYLYADSCDEKGSMVLSSQSQEAIEFVENIAPICGLAVTGKSTSTVLETNFGKRKSPLMKITLRENTKFYVTNIEDLYDDEVFCVVEPKTKTFTLEHGVLTGNCAAIAVNHPRVFDEIFYLLMCGCGVGFSVERQYTNELPKVAEEFHDTDTTIDIKDSKLGWAKGLKELIALLYNGDIPIWDLSSVRPEGSRLRTFGGRASGPEPLDALFRYTVRLFCRAAGRRLNSLECHDLICKIADTVIVGSVRRSACISLSNLTDDRMRRAKNGEWYLTNPQRMLANNSVAYTEKPDLISYLKEFRNLYQSKAGERGIVNKEALRDKAEGCGREYEGDYLLNPCGEAILRDSGGMCNLTEVVVRSDDTLEDLKRKVKYATILGTLQSTLTEFRYLRSIWKTNQEEERLLGISLTGIMDHTVMSNKAPTISDYYVEKWAEGMGWCLEDILYQLKGVARETNSRWAELLGIPASKQLTLVKPSGTVSQLCGTSSGIHPRFAPFYLRRVTQDNKDPMTEMMKSQEIPYVVRGEKTIFSFPIKSPDGSIVARDMGAMQQLELWKIYRDYWCDGNPSQTIYYTDDEFLEVQSWVWKNWDSIGGLSFFPLDDYIYDKDAQPYLEITEEEYEEYLKDFPEEIDWATLSNFEYEDGTSSPQEFACAGDNCEL